MGVVMILAVSTANARGADGSARAPADVARCEALMKEAAALKKAGKPAEAIEKLKEANAADPDMLPVYCETGDLYTALGDYARALVWYEKSLEINYNQPQLWERVKTAKARIAASGGGIATNDLFALCEPLDRTANWSDVYHFRPEAIAKQADQVATAVLSALQALFRTHFADSVEPFEVAPPL